VFEELVALTGIEPDGWRFGSVQLGSKWLFFQSSWYSTTL
jgi:hypothetical protein